MTRQQRQNHRTTGFSFPLDQMQYPVELRAATPEQLAAHLAAYEAAATEPTEYSEWLRDCVENGYRFA